MNPLTSQPQPVALSFGKVSGYCTGVQKLVQRYIILLNTVLGSQPDFKQFGTELHSSLLSGKLSNPVEFQHTFNFANWSAVSTIKAWQLNNTAPLDEQLSTTTLVKFAIAGDSISAEIKLTTMAGEDIVFVMPLPLE
jgi:hypothetical protein